MPRRLLPQWRWCGVVALTMSSTAALAVMTWTMPTNDVDAAGPGVYDIPPPTDIITQYATPRIRTLDAESDTITRVATARSQFGVDGTGLTIAVLDTGLRTTHVDFAGKVVAVRNFTNSDGSNVNAVTDRDGHGTNVAGIATARGIHTGVAPGANLVALKVLGDNGSGQSNWITSALDWVIQNRVLYNITVVNMSLGIGTNDTSDSFDYFLLRSRIQTLRSSKVAVCISAGNDFGFYQTEGMGYPGIIRESVSVGCVYDANIGSQFYGDCTALSTGPRRITPFSQRLHETTDSFCRTDVFAPGAISTSSGNLSDTGESDAQGTSQAAPCVAGICLLLQQFALRTTGTLPTVDQLETWLRDTAAGNTIVDGDDEDDDVLNTGKTYILSDAVGALTRARTDLRPPPPTPVPSQVTVVYTPGTKTFTLTGDAAQNNVTISRSGTKITLTGGNGTKLKNGSAGAAVSTLSFNNVSGSVIVNGSLHGSNDSISLVSMQCSLVELNLGDGNDRLMYNLCTVTTSKTNGGNGTDTYVATSSRVTSNQNTSFP